MPHKISATIPIIDSHCHLWDLSLNKHAWLTPSEPSDQMIASFNQFDTIKKDYVLAQYRSDCQAYNIQKMVHIQAGWDRADSLGETQWLTQLHQQQGFPHAIVAYANLMSPTIEQELAALTAFPLVKGIRQIVAWSQVADYRACEHDFLNDALWQQNFALLERYDLSFDLQIYPEQAELAYDLLARYPGIPVVIEHLLQPTHHTPEYLEYWRRQLARLASLPHITIKLSGAFSFEHSPSPALFKHLLTSAIDCFGPERCLFGSNFPVEGRFTDFDTLLQRSLQAIEDYSAAQQHDLLYGSAARFYRLP